MGDDSLGTAVVVVVVVFEEEEEEEEEVSVLVVFVSHGGVDRMVGSNECCSSSVKHSCNS